MEEKKVLTDEEAKQEAQEKFRRRAEKELALIIDHFQREKLRWPSENDLKRVLKLFAYSDACRQTFLDISELFEKWANRLKEKGPHVCPIDEANSEGILYDEICKKNPTYCHIPLRGTRAEINILRKASEAFLKLAAQ